MLKDILLILYLWTSSACDEIISVLISYGNNFEVNKCFRSLGNNWFPETPEAQNTLKANLHLFFDYWF